MPFFRLVEGFHNWVFYYFLENEGQVNYKAYDDRYKPKTHMGGGKVSYILREGDPRKCHVSYSIITKWEHKRAQKSDYYMAPM